MIDQMKRLSVSTPMSDAKRRRLDTGDPKSAVSWSNLMDWMQRSRARKREKH